jgi:hypothetical protein
MKEDIMTLSNTDGLESVVSQNKYKNLDSLKVQ